MTPTIDRTILLQNLVNENIAEFLLCSDEGYSYVKCIPYFGMFEMYRQDASDIVIVYPGMIMPDKTFLGYISNLARFPALRAGVYPYHMGSGHLGQYTQVIIREGMYASEIADLTGYPLEMVRDFYKDYFVVKIKEEKK
jgi:hypothetical protein